MILNEKLAILNWRRERDSNWALNLLILYKILNHFFPVTHTITQIFFNSNLFIHVNIIQKTNSAYEYSNTMEAIDIFLHKPSSFNALPFHCNFSLRFTRNRHSIFSCQIISLFISFLAIVRCTRIKEQLK